MPSRTLHAKAVEMDIAFKSPTLPTVMGLSITFLLFAGRWGIPAEDQTQYLPDIFAILFISGLQLRWWFIAAILLAVFSNLCTTNAAKASLSGSRGTKAFLLLAFTLVLSATYTYHAEETLFKVIEVIAMTLIVLAIHYCQNVGYATDEQLQEATLLSCFLLGTTLSLLAVATSDFTQRASVADGGPNTFVRIVGATAISCIGLSRIPQGVAFAATVGYLSLVILTQSRGGLLAFLIAVSVQFTWAFGLRSKIIYGALALTSLGIVANFTSVGHRCVEIIEERVFSQTFVYTYTSGRDDIYSHAWSLWKENILFGIGLNASRSELHTYPHNIFMEIGCDAGLVGVLIFVALLGTYAWCAIQCDTLVSKSIACMTLFYFLAAQFSGDLYDSRGLFFFGAMLASRQILLKNQTAKRIR
jgi:O-antigen ligase